MSYWEISPHHNIDYDSCIMPGNTEEDHQAALEYAKERLEELWDNTSTKDGPVSVTIELHDGEMPEFEEY